MQTSTDSSTYNSEDWTTSNTDNGLTTSYGYDAAGQERTESVLTGTAPVTTTLDAEGRQTALTEAVNSSTPYTDQFAYNANDLPLTITLHSGATQVQELAQYDANSRLTSWHDPGPGQNVTYAYGYNAIGWITSASTVSGTDTITHDAQGRMQSESGPQTIAAGGRYAWTYNTNGNITSAIDDTGVTQYFTYSLSQPNELTQTSATGYPTVAYTYDGAGNTTSISTTSIGTINPVMINTHLSYDAQERPMTITLIDGTVVTLTYNAAGQRASYSVTPQGQSQPSYSAQFTYRDGQVGQASVVSATSGGGSISYVDTFLYTSDGTPLQLIRQQGGMTSHYWYETDGRGTVMALTDSSGNVVDSYEYDQWGEPLPNTTHETVPQPLRYQGYWFDSALGWYWVDGRYYDAELERYYQPDGSSARSYVFAQDDPVAAGLASSGGQLAQQLGANSVANGVGLIAGGFGAVGISPSAVLAPSCEPPEESDCPEEGGEGVKAFLRAGGAPPYITEPLVNDLVRDSNPNFRLTARNAIRALYGPLSTVRAEVAGPRVQGADVRFFDAEYATVPSYLREAKSVTGVGGFTSAVEKAIEKQGIRESTGDVFVQVPEGTNGEEWIARLEGSLRSKGKQAIAVNVRIQLVDPKGTVLVDQPLYGQPIP